VEEHGADRNLSVKNWAFHREKNIGLIFCTSEARQKRIISHIIDIGLGGHVVETEHDLVDGMDMSFKMPACFESQQMATLIEAIFVVNKLAGHCGHRDLRTDRPKHRSRTRSARSTSRRTWLSMPSSMSGGCRDLTA
jgi:hypothetical protein